MDDTYKMLTSFSEIIPQKKRRDSRHWWRRICSRKFRPTIIKKTIYVTLITVAITLIWLLYTKPTDTLALLWAILLCAIIIPDKSKEEKSKSYAEILKEVEEIKRRTQDPTTPEARYVAEIRERNNHWLRRLRFKWRRMKAKYNI